MNEYDSPNFFEYVYDVKNDGKTKLLRTAAIALYIAFAAVYFIVACSIPLYPIIAVLPIFIWMLVFFTWGLVCYDFYYEFKHGDIEFGTVRVTKNGRHRRKKLAINVKNAREARVYDKNDAELLQVKKIYDFSESQSSDKRIVIFIDVDGVYSAIIFEGTAKIAKLIASYCDGAKSLKGEILHG